MATCITKFFQKYLNGKRMISSVPAFRPNLFPIKAAAVKDATMQKIVMKVHIQDIGVKSFTRFHIFVV